MRSPGGGLLGRLLDPGDEGRGQLAQTQPGEDGVDPGEDVGGGVRPVVGDAAQDAADLAHRRGGVHVVADDVADDEQRGPVRLLERVVPVTPDVQVAAGRAIADGELEVVGLRRGGEQAALQRLGDRLLPAVEPGVVQRQGAAAGDLDGGGDLHLGVRGAGRRS